MVQIKIITLILFLILGSLLTYGQISQGGLPYSFEPNLVSISGKNISTLGNIEKITMPVISKAAIDSIKQKILAKEHVLFNLLIVLKRILT